MENIEEEDSDENKTPTMKITKIKNIMKSTRKKKKKKTLKKNMTTSNEKD